MRERARHAVRVLGAAAWHGAVKGGRCQATWIREFKVPWREADSPNHHDDVVDSDQQVVNDLVAMWP